MPAPFVIVVMEDDHPAAFEVRTILLAPCAGPERVRRGNEPLALKAPDIFLAFDNEDGPLGVGGEQLRQPIEDAPHAFQVRHPPALAVRASYAEALARPALDLVAEGVDGVIIAVHRVPAPGPFGAPRRRRAKR